VHRILKVARKNPIAPVASTVRQSHQNPASVGHLLRKKSSPRRTAPQLATPFVSQTGQLEHGITVALELHGFTKF
jgi:hypothetical protein